MKRRIRLTESDLHKIVKESVKRAIKEATDPDTDGAWEYQGGPNYQNFIKARSNWFLKNKDKGFDGNGLTANEKNHDHSTRMYRNDSWIDDTTHGAPKETTIRFEIENQLTNAINKIQKIKKKMNLSWAERSFLGEIEEDINAIQKKLYDYEEEEGNHRYEGA